MRLRKTLLEKMYLANYQDAMKRIDNGRSDAEAV
jgi:hypothetical protein